MRIKLRPFKIFPGSVGKRGLAILLSVIACQIAHADAEKRRKVAWAAVKAAAEDWVTKESGADTLPFEFPERRALVGLEKKVFAHYFSPFPLSFDNKPWREDAYSRVHLSPEGSDKALAGKGGYKAGGGGTLRQRPLPMEPWNSPDWKEINLAIEILRARNIGLDGFSYDMLAVSPGKTHFETLKTLLKTAEQVAPDFKIMLMPDMNAELSANPEKLADAIRDVASSPALFRLDDGRLLISPYNCSAQPPSFWKKLMDNLGDEGIPCALLPVFLGYENMEKNGQSFAPISWGLSDWGFRDIQFAEEFDFRHAAAKARPYSPNWMMPVAPQDVRPKDLVTWESENTRCFRYLWQAARDGGSRFVQLVTWNDYSEATEISPSSASQFAYYDLSAFYTAWFKTGREPSIKRDAFYYTHRTQILPWPVGIKADKQREPFRQVGKTPFRNHVEMLAMLTRAAVLEIEQQGRTERKEAPAGLTVFSVPLLEGRPVFRIVRDGKVVVEQASEWMVHQGGDVENPVYHGGSSTRPQKKSTDNSNNLTPPH